MLFSVSFYFVPCSISFFFAIFALDILRHFPSINSSIFMMQAKTNQFEKLLNLVGPFGKYQFRLLALTCYSAIPLAATIYLTVITQANPTHYCKIPGYLETYENITDSNLHSLIPVSQNERSCGGNLKYDQCHQFNEIGSNSTQNQTTNCQNGHIWDRSIFNSTVTEDFNFFCTRKGKSLKAISSSLLFAGMVLSSLFTGYVCDNIGRKWTAIFGLMVSFTVVVWQTYRVVLQKYRKNGRKRQKMPKTVKWPEIDIFRLKITQN